MRGKWNRTVRVFPLLRCHSGGKAHYRAITNPPLIIIQTSKNPLFFSMSRFKSQWQLEFILKIFNTLISFWVKQIRTAFPPKFLWNVWCFFVSLCQPNEITLYHKIQNLSRFYWLSSRQLHCSFLIHVECLNTTAISVLYRHIDRFWHWITKQAAFKGSNCRIS